MNQLKKGNKVKVVSAGRDSYWYANRIGDVFTLSNQISNGDWRVVEDPDGCLAANDIELYVDEKESISKFLREEKWWIKCSSQSELDVLNLWLIEHFGYSLDIPAPKNMQYVCNDLDYANEVFWGYGNSDSKGAEIKLEYATVVASVQLPEIPPKKTEAQLKIEALEKTIEQAQRELQELKEMK